MTTRARLPIAIAALALAIATPFVAQKEGVSLTPYYDVGNVLTDCYGRTGRGVELGSKMTIEQCQEFLNHDLRETHRLIAPYVKVEVTPTTWAAMLSFAYNVGTGAFRSSTLLRKLNAGDTKGACDEMLRWSRVKKVVVQGLVNRRKAERELCLAGL